MERWVGQSAGLRQRARTPTLQKCTRKPLQKPLFFVGVKAESGGINAEAKACRRGAVFEDVAEVRVATAAEDFGADHAVRCVAMHFDIFGIDWLGVAGPATAGMKFCV